MVALPAILKNKTVVRVTVAILVVVAVVCLMRMLGSGKCECRAAVTPSPSPSPLLMMGGGQPAFMQEPTYEPRGIEAWQADDDEEEEEETEGYAAHGEEMETMEDDEEAFRSAMDHASLEEEAFAADDFSGVEFRSDLLQQ